MFAVSSLSLCLSRDLQTRTQQLLLDCFVTTKIVLQSKCWTLAHACKPTNTDDSKKNLGDSQTDHREGLRHLRSVAKRNAKTLKNQLDLGEIQSKNSWETPALKLTESTYV